MKYAPLQDYLAAHAGPQIELDFQQIEQIIGAPLPPKAQTYRAWWSNNPSNNVMTKAWLGAGYRSEKVDMAARRLVFRRQNTGVAEAPSALPPVGLGGGLSGLYGALRGTIRIADDLTKSTGDVWAAERDGEH